MKSRANSLLSLWLLFTAIVASGQTNETAAGQDLIQEFRNSEFTLSFKTSDIPKKFFKQINNGRKIKLEMVNPGEEYNKTDIRTRNEPNSSLLFLGISDKKLYVLMYDLGGYGVSRRSYLFKKEGKRFVTKEIVLNSSIENISQMKIYLEKKP